MTVFMQNKKIWYFIGTIISISLILAILLTSPIQRTKAANNTSKPEEVFQVFNRIPLDDEAIVEQIVFSDTNVNELTKDNEYSFTVDGHQISGQDWNLALGVKLKDGTDVNEWLRQGKSDKSVIEEYVGVLNIGHNDGYMMSIDVENERIDKFTYFSRKAISFQELTLNEKKNIVEIALGDPRIQELLQDKEFTIAPEGVHIWIGEGNKTIGGTICIWFDRSYEIEFDWPYPAFDAEKYPEFPNYGVESVNRTLDVKALFIMVDLGKQEVTGILDRPVNKHTDDLYKP
jgi:hypothetical protein